MTSEHERQTAIILYLTETGAVVIRANSGRKGNVPFYWLYFPQNFADLVTFEEVLGICDGNFKKASDIWENAESAFTKGISDLIVLPPLKGSVFDNPAFLEVKDDHGKPTIEQQFFLLIMQRLGYVAEVVRSVENVREALGLPVTA